MDTSNLAEGDDLVVVFLDIDGVLLPFPANKELSIRRGRIFPDATLSALSWIFERVPTAKLVLSSTWRVKDSFRNDILRDFQSYGGALPGSFHDITNPALHTERQHEIYAWLELNGPVAAWVALDDEELIEGSANERYRSLFESHVIHCNPRVGLVMDDAKEAVRLVEAQLLLHQRRQLKK